MSPWETALKAESKRLRGHVGVLCIGVSSFIFLAIIGSELVRLSGDNPVDVSVLLSSIGGDMRLIGGFWPAGVDPLTVGFAITSLAIAMVVTVAVAKLPSQGSTPALQLTVDEYVRLTALVASARTVSTVGGGIIWLLVPVLATGDAYPKFCCVIFVLLGLLCFRLAATLPVPVSYWEADQEEMQVKSCCVVYEGDSFVWVG